MKPTISKALLLFVIACGIFNADELDLASERKQDYCTSVDIWNETNDPRFHLEGATVPSGHPDYRNVYNSICEVDDDL